MSSPWGHGVEITFEEPWIDTASDVTIRAGICLALEQRISLPGVGGANYGDVEVVTDSGTEILTEGADR